MKYSYLAYLVILVAFVAGWGGKTIQVQHQKSEKCEAVVIDVNSKVSKTTKIGCPKGFDYHPVFSYTNDGNVSHVSCSCPGKIMESCWSEDKLPAKCAELAEE